MSPPSAHRRVAFICLAIALVAISKSAHADPEAPTAPALPASALGEMVCKPAVVTGTLHHHHKQEPHHKVKVMVIAPNGSRIEDVKKAMADQGITNINVETGGDADEEQKPGPFVENPTLTYQKSKQRHVPGSPAEQTLNLSISGGYRLPTKNKDYEKTALGFDLEAETLPLPGLSHKINDFGALVYLYGSEKGSDESGLTYGPKFGIATVTRKDMFNTSTLSPLGYSLSYTKPLTKKLILTGAIDAVGPGVEYTRTEDLIRNNGFFAGSIEANAGLQYNFTDHCRAGFVATYQGSLGQATGFQRAQASESEARAYVNFDNKSATYNVYVAGKHEVFRAIDSVSADSVVLGVSVTPNFRKH